MYQRWIHLPLNPGKTVQLGQWSSSHAIYGWGQDIADQYTLNKTPPCLGIRLPTYLCSHHSEPHCQQIPESYTHADLACSIYHPLHQKFQSKLCHSHQAPCVQMSSWSQPGKGRSSCLLMGKPFPSNSCSIASFLLVILRRLTKYLWRTKIYNHTGY